MGTTAKTPSADNLSASHCAHLSRILLEGIDDFLGNTNYSGNSQKLDGLAKEYFGPFSSRTANGYSKYSQMVGPHKDDLKFPATIENKAIAVAAIEHHVKTEGWSDQDAEETGGTWQDRVKQIQAAEGQIGRIGVLDIWLMAYFADKCEALAKGPAADARLTSAEHAILADILRWMLLWMLKLFDLGFSGYYDTYQMLPTDRNVELVTAMYEEQWGQYMGPGPEEYQSDYFGAYAAANKAVQDKKITEAERDAVVGHLYIEYALVLTWFTNLCNCACGRPELFIDIRDRQKVRDQGDLSHSSGIKGPPPVKRRADEPPPVAKPAQRFPPASRSEADMAEWIKRQRELACAIIEYVAVPYGDDNYVEENDPYGRPGLIMVDWKDASTDTIDNTREAIGDRDLDAYLENPDDGIVFVRFGDRLIFVPEDDERCGPDDKAVRAINEVLSPTYELRILAGDSGDFCLYLPMDKSSWDGLDKTFGPEKVDKFFTKLDFDPTAGEKSRQKHD